MIKNKVLIIGSGIAGLTASIYLSRAELKPILITGNKLGGQLIESQKIDNWPGEYKGITGYNIIKNIKKQTLKFKTNIINDNIINLKIKNNSFILKGIYNTYISKTIIIATGLKSKKIKIKNKFYKKGISTCGTCDGYFYKNKIIAIIGGGNTAIEETLFLCKIVKKIFLIHRKNYFTSEKYLIKKIKKKIKEGKIILLRNYLLKKINYTNNKIKNIEIKSNIKKKKKIINISRLFIFIGYKPNTKIFKKIIKLDKNNFIKINYKKNKYKSMTNIKGIFAAGDVTNEQYKQAIIASSSGCIAALDVIKYLEKKK